MATSKEADSLPTDELERAREALAAALLWWNVVLAAELPAPEQASRCRKIGLKAKGEVMNRVADGLREVVAIVLWATRPGERSL